MLRDNSHQLGHNCVVGDDKLVALLQAPVLLRALKVEPAWVAGHSKICELEFPILLLIDAVRAVTGTIWHVRNMRNEQYTFWIVKWASNEI